MDVKIEIKEIKKDMIIANEIFTKAMSKVWDRLEKVSKEL